MKKIVFVILGALLFFIFVLGVSAQQMHKGEVVTIPVEQTVNGNYFAGGELVEIKGTIDGDLYAAGGRVIVSGRVTGDILAAGGEVKISGSVGQDVRVAGGDVTIAGNVDGNITGVGSSVYLLSSVGKDIVAAGGLVKVGGLVGRDVLVGADKVILNNKANVRRDFTYFSSNPAEVQRGALVAGRTIHHGSSMLSDKNNDSAKLMQGAYVAQKLLSFFSAFLIGFLLFKLAPRFMRETADHIGNRSWTTLGLGFALVFLAPFAVVLLALSIIGIPLAVFGVFVYVAYIYLAKIFVWYYFGRKIFKNKKKQSDLFILFVGLLIYFVLTLFSLIGWPVSLFTTVFGVGALAMQKNQYIRLLKKKNLI